MLRIKVKAIEFHLLGLLSNESVCITWPGRQLEDKDVTPAHGHLKPVTRQVEDNKNENLRHLSCSPPKGLCFASSSFSSCSHMPCGCCGLPCSWQPGGVHAAGGPQQWWCCPDGYCAEGYIMAPGLGRDSAALVQQRGPCSPQQHTALSYGCSAEFFDSCLACPCSGLPGV